MSRLKFLESFNPISSPNQTPPVGTARSPNIYLFLPERVAYRPLSSNIYSPASSSSSGRIRRGLVTGWLDGWMVECSGNFSCFVQLKVCSPISYSQPPFLRLAVDGGLGG